MGGMSGTDARGWTHPQPLIPSVGTLKPTTPKPDKSLIQLRSVGLRARNRRELIPLVAAV
jgi:hypothetical protein